MKLELNMYGKATSILFTESHICLSRNSGYCKLSLGTHIPILQLQFRPLSSSRTLENWGSWNDVVGWFVNIWETPLANLISKL